MLRFTLLGLMLIAPLAVGQSLVLAQRVSRPSKGWRIGSEWALNGLQGREEKRVAESVRAEFVGKLNLNRNFDEKIDIRVVPSVRFLSGREQDVFSERLPKDKIYAEEARLKWQASPEIALRAGALSQTHLNNPLIVANRPFPGFILDFEPTTALRFDIQYAIPTSYTLDSNVTANESLPSFRSFMAGYSSAIGDYKVGASLDYFKFADLPNIVAISSHALGNSVDVFSSATARFRYEYEGIGAGLDFDTELGRWSLGWSGSAIRNFQAPQSLNTGIVSTLRGMFAMTAVHGIGTSISYYRIEPDTSPAVYTDPVFSNNRVGAGGSLYLNHSKWRLKFAASVYHDNPLYQNDLMGARDIFLLSVGTLGEEVHAGF